MSQGPTHNAEDAQVIEESWSDPEQFRIIFLRHHSMIYQYLVRRCGPDAASEIASETFVAAFSQRKRYNMSYSSSRPWLFGIATNLLRNHFRRAATERAKPPPVEVDTAEFADDIAWRTDAERVVRETGLVDAINALRPDERDVLLLFALGDLTYSEIAETLAIPVGTVRSRLSRLRHRLYPLLRDTLNGEPV